jgi:hypothetical protein
MSTVAEIKAALERLGPQERRELYHWVNQRDDFQQQRLEDLRHEIALGIDQADRGDLAPLDMAAVKEEGSHPEHWRG